MTCSIERQSQPTIRFNLGFFLYWITAPHLKIGIHLLSNRSLDGIRTLTVQPPFFSWITDARATTSGNASREKSIKSKMNESYYE